MAGDQDGERSAAALRATTVVYARAEGDPWLVSWTACNRYVPEEAIRQGTVEVSPLASGTELEDAVRAAVYGADRALWATIEDWAVGDWPLIRELSLPSRSVAE